MEKKSQFAYKYKDKGSTNHVALNSPHEASMCMDRNTLHAHGRVQPLIEAIHPGELIPDFSVSKVRGDTRCVAYQRNTDQRGIDAPLSSMTHPAICWKYTTSPPFAVPPTMVSLRSCSKADGNEIYRFCSPGGEGRPALTSRYRPPADGRMHRV